MIPFGGQTSVEYNGTTFYRFFRIEKVGKYLLKFKIISVNSDYKQGIALKFSDNPVSQGGILLDGTPLMLPKKKNQVYVFEADSIPDKEFVVQLCIPYGFVSIGNASDILPDYISPSYNIPESIRSKFQGKESFTSGFTAAAYSFDNGNAFWIEERSNSVLRFHCNDHKSDEDFDDFIFDMEIVDFY